MKPDQLNLINVSGQTCDTFGVHEALPIVNSLYNDQNLVFFANTGAMTRPVTKNNYKTLTATQLFGHNTMQHEAKRVDPLKQNDGTGVLGRMSDVLIRQGRNVGSFGVDGNSVAVVGKNIVRPIVISKEGLSPFYASDVIIDAIGKLNNETTSDSGFFGETWSSNLVQSINSHRHLMNAFTDVPDMVFPPSDLGKKLKTVSETIATRNERGVDTDVFYVEMENFDTHGNVNGKLNELFEEANEAISAFSAGLKEMGLWSNVTTIQVSDFGRTLSPNGGRYHRLCNENLCT